MEPDGHETTSENAYPEAPVKMAGHCLDVSIFRRAVRKWGVDHSRTFPWRLSREPYQILIAEVMLHRTQARQVVLVYERFVMKYPNAKELAQASSDGSKTVCSRWTFAGVSL